MLFLVISNLSINSKNNLHKIYMIVLIDFTKSTVYIFTSKLLINYLLIEFLLIEVWMYPRMPHFHCYMEPSHCCLYISNTYKSQLRIWNLEYVVSGLFSSSKPRRVRKSGTNFYNRCLEAFPLKCMCLLKFIYNLFSIGFKW